MTDALWTEAELVTERFALVESSIGLLGRDANCDSVLLFWWLGGTGFLSVPLQVFKVGERRSILLALLPWTIIDGIGETFFVGFCKVSPCFANTAAGAASSFRECMCGRCLTLGSTGRKSA